MMKRTVQISVKSSGIPYIMESVKPRVYYKRKTKNEIFFEDYAREVDLFDQQESFPQWVYDYRENVLNKITKDFRVLCQMLKDAGFSFKVKYPIEVKGKWKYADVFLPDDGIVVLLINDFETIGLPCHSKTDREIFFENRYRVVAVCTYEVKRAAEKVKAKIVR